MTLTLQERQRFIIWLENETSQANSISEQLKKVNSPEAVIKKYLAEAMACRVVASMLKSIEEDIIQ